MNIIFQRILEQNEKLTEEDLKPHDSICAGIYDNNGKILILKHAKWNVWSMPVGKVKENQTIEEGLKEELFEELNIKVKNFKEIGNRKYYYHNEGQTIKSIIHVFDILSYSGTIKNMEPEKHKDLNFITSEKLKNLRPVLDAVHLYRYLKGIDNKLITNEHSKWLKIW